MYLDILSKYLDKETVSNINKIVEKRIVDEKLDKDRVYKVIEDKLTDTDLTSVRNFKKWINVVITNIFLERHNDMIVSHVSVNLLPLFMKLESKGYPRDGENEFYIELITNHIVNEFPVEPKQVGELYDQVIEFIDSKGKDKTYSNFIDLVLKSKLVKQVSIPVELKDRAKELNKEWNAVTKELDSIPSKEITTEDALNYKGDNEDAG